MQNSNNQTNEYVLLAEKVLKECGAFMDNQDEFNQMLINTFVEQLSLRVGSHLLSLLTDEIAEQFHPVEGKTSQDEIQSFFKQHIPNYENEITKAVEEFCKEYMELSQG